MCYNKKINLKVLDKNFLLCKNLFVMMNILKGKRNVNIIFFNSKNIIM